MNSQTARLIASLQPRSVQSLQNVEYHKLANKLLNMGYENMLLSGAFIEQFSDGVLLFVDNDVELLFDCYLYLENLLLIEEPYKHFACLNDGLLNISSKSDRERTEIKFEYWPGLNATNLITYTTDVAADKYVWWWRNVAYEILNLTSVK